MIKVDQHITSDNFPPERAWSIRHGYKLEQEESAHYKAWIWNCTCLNIWVSDVGSRRNAAPLLCMMDPGMEAVWEDLRQCHRLRNEMAHLVTSLQAYIMFEVVEAAWTALQERLRTTQDLDGLIRKHCFCHPPSAIHAVCSRGLCLLVLNRGRFIRNAFNRAVFPVTSISETAHPKQPLCHIRALCSKT